MVKLETGGWIFHCFNLRQWGELGLEYVCLPRGKLGFCISESSY